MWRPKGGAPRAGRVCECGAYSNKHVRRLPTAVQARQRSFLDSGAGGARTAARSTAPQQSELSTLLVPGASVHIVPGTERAQRVEGVEYRTTTPRVTPPLNES